LTNRDGRSSANSLISCSDSHGAGCGRNSSDHSRRAEVDKSPTRVAAGPSCQAGQILCSSIIIIAGSHQWLRLPDRKGYCAGGDGYGGEARTDKESPASRSSPKQEETGQAGNKRQFAPGSSHNQPQLPQESVPQSSCQIVAERFGRQSAPVPTCDTAVRHHSPKTKNEPFSRTCEENAGMERSFVYPCQSSERVLSFRTAFSGEESAVFSRIGDTVKQQVPHG
jgi:hypothetical protein